MSMQVPRVIVGLQKHYNVFPYEIMILAEDETDARVKFSSGTTSVQTLKAAAAIVSCCSVVISEVYFKKAYVKFVIRQAGFNW